MNKKEIIKDVEDYINGKYNLGIIDDKIVKDCINKTLEAINYTHCCKSDSELLPKRLSNEAYKCAKTMDYTGFVNWWDKQV